MSRKSFAVGVLATALAVSLAAPLAAPAFADTPPSTSAPARDLGAAKARCTAAIDVRLAKLTQLEGRVDRAKRLTDGHRATLHGINTNARTGLTALRTKIEGDSDAATLKSDCQSIVLDYRIFALRAPQENLVIAADAETAAVTKLQSVEPKLSDAIAKAEAAGKDVTAAKAAFADLEAKVNDASQHVTGLANTVIGYQPADYNANHELLTPARTNVKTAVADLKAASADVRTIVTSLRSQATTSTTGAAS